jgi:acylphosphatase
VRVHVSGRVQGVGFRWICAQEAKAHGVSGFVRNLPDGRVEAVFEGPPEAVQAMLDWVGHGPSYAEVTSVEATDEPPEGASGFEIDS